MRLPNAVHVSKPAKLIMHVGAFCSVPSSVSASECLLVLLARINTYTGPGHLWEGRGGGGLSPFLVTGRRRRGRRIACTAATLAWSHVRTTKPFGNRRFGSHSSKHDMFTCLAYSVPQPTEYCESKPACMSCSKVRLQLAHAEKWGR